MTLFQNEIFLSKAAAHGVYCITVQDELDKEKVYEALRVTDVENY
jgi:hypothetical protein